MHTYVIISEGGVVESQRRDSVQLRLIYGLHTAVLASPGLENIGTAACRHLIIPASMCLSLVALVAIRSNADG